MPLASRNTLNRSLLTALCADALLEKAARQTGLADFGGDAFREPLEILLQSLREEGRLSTRGVFIMGQTLPRLLTNRLLTEQAFADNPAMNDTPIHRPLFILDLPRTGTTLLHNLLACDPNARWLPLWAGLYPASPPGSLRDDPRIGQAEKWIATFEKAVPRFATAHKLSARGPEECLWLMEHTFADIIFELRAHVPGYAQWLAAHEADVGIYRYFRRQLRMLAARSRDRHPWSRHWVLKAPRHLPGLSGLLAVFPDARMVQTHRDPAAVLPSLCSLCAILRSAFSDRVDKHAIGAHWQGRMGRIAQQAGAARGLAEPGRFLDVHYDDLVGDPIGVARRIYGHHGYEYSERFEANMRGWLADNRQHKYGAHRYTLEEYGLDGARIRNDFARQEGAYRVSSFTARDAGR
uniref:Sulfotransferase family protein n=1 Tax=Candidatus Kentrum eta TaxID=2126337 RepID=A0A450U963_9GAMM|nr:MAG: Sulfotransferase family protein [Candidatus Kentron sp. H]VFJ92797.1 MAG: Sulfotransferase family protein [Candidatus Kentron sp. H]VFJ94764.1 MAG: Sulfotransferase family protein [Candidatus Kentron sp. H]